MFRYLREQDVRFYESGLFALVRMLPISQMGGAQQRFAAAGLRGFAVSVSHVSRTIEKNLLRADGFDRWVTDAIARMREGVAKGVVLPRVLIERVLPQIEAHLDGPVEDTLFYRPIRNMPASFASRGARASWPWRIARRSQR